MKYLKLSLFAVIALFASFIYLIITSPVVIDAAQTVELISEEGSCSGSYVKAPSGKTYMISAGHCAGIADIMGYMPVLHEDGTITHVRIVALDINNDLMLLENDDVGMVGISVSDKIQPGEKIYAYTHPLGNKLTLSLGRFDWYKMVRVSTFTNLECGATLPGVNFGSSGGPVLNYKGNLVGIISAGNEETGEEFFVTLEDIKTFLARF